MISLREDIRNHPINSVTSYTFQDLQDDFNGLTKGIDELIEYFNNKLNENSLQRYPSRTINCEEVIDKLKNLKGE